MNIEKITSEFVSIIDVAILEAEKEILAAQKTKNDLLAEHCKKIIQYLNGIREMAISGELPRISNSGIGVLQGVSDWDVSKSFFKACAEVEKYYQNKYNA
ncbi:hypothetical protein [Desulfuromonas sp. AOP6]|uniref:hypothetical protein n=1 Tax=Desulfuromonas sp. AOP6 TaxID=1566351 RepID=UPI0012896303|nr:hypothetical protein [Desulfuromonas sp. AOP6]BCA78573.1 hypothetical protein AOP6_0360 [Desulfuromonas sp. AOP6]BCA78577.1 hypothetical protein AOP6_0364 [Desulfuromonas sp. AOP6]BCA80948.1 hypothetical protein AOP6_2735 [Desulfuromonas sp. AOP6]